MWRVHHYPQGETWNSTVEGTVGVSRITELLIKAIIENATIHIDGSTLIKIHITYPDLTEVHIVPVY